MEAVTTRKIPQSFGLNLNQIEELQDLSKQTGKSLSQLAREAVDNLLKQKKEVNENE
jgi:predicted DNA-binding protein